MFFSSLQQVDSSLLARAVASILRESGEPLTALQQRWLTVVFRQLLRTEWDPISLKLVTPFEVDQRWPEASKRLELIELLASLELLCNPISPGLHAAVTHWAAALAIESDSLLLIRDLALHHQRRATRAWYRLSWFGQQALAKPSQLSELAGHGVMAIALTFEPDPREASRWRGLADCPPGSLGRSLFQLLDREGVGFPGEPGATHPTLALHDWIHVITGCPMSPLGEIATAAYIAAASRSSAATLAFLGTISIFEASLLDYHVDLSAPDCPAEMPRYAGALSTPGAVEQVAQAIQTGRLCPIDPLIDVDYFQHASECLQTVRQRWQLPPEGLWSGVG